MVPDDKASEPTDSGVAAPAWSTEPSAMFTAPPRVPLPPRVAPLATCTAALFKVPLTSRLPVLTLVLPVKVLLPLSSNAPVPVLFNTPVPVRLPV